MHIFQKHMFILVYSSEMPYEGGSTTEWLRPIGCPVFIGHFPPKSHILSGSFAERDL